MADEKGAKKQIIGKKIAYLSLFTAVTVVCSWLSIPTPIAFTLQTLAIFLAVCVLGAKYAFFVVCAYLGLGFVGVPVFAGFRGGISALFSATGGYLIGYFLGGGLMWGLQLLPLGKAKQVVTLIVGQLIYYVCGVLWYMFVFVSGNVGFWSALTVCVLPFLLPDAGKMLVAIFLSKKIKTWKGKNLFRR